MKNEKICLIGNGVHSKANIIPSLKELNINISSISSIYDENNQINGVNYYKDYKKMIDKEKPTIIFIVTKAELQYEITKYCLEKNIKKIFVEKPMGMNFKEARELEELSTIKNCKLFVGFMKKFSPCYKLLKDISQKKEFGKIKHFASDFYITSGRNGWNNEIFLIKGGIHFCNLMLFYFGEIEDIKSFSSSVENNVSLTSIIKFKNGIVGSLNFIGLNSWKSKCEKIVITGENGYVFNDGIREVSYHFDKPIKNNVRWQNIDEEVNIIKPYITSASGGLQDLYLNGYVEEIKYFLSDEVESNALENTKTMELIENILKSII